MFSVTKVTLRMDFTTLSIFGVPPSDTLTVIHSPSNTGDEGLLNGNLTWRDLHEKPLAMFVFENSQILSPAGKYGLVGDTVAARPFRRSVVITRLAAADP